jgi:hypothetical protein
MRKRHARRERMTAEFSAASFWTADAVGVAGNKGGEPRISDSHKELR